ncbi:diguanylate cyclase domain-containing protein [Brevibacillus invocatus]|uniref:diguanylate cyclase domain-containing protein n=1 Tax=Brevibacillus invocatus TaxID=173959 RepID=UPI00203ACC9C|nr:GGDEF domain-containing protein [Brevibacillus invocatus]MCM3430145.1 GGDEF domain-containing protein [Brevibacillus invocatus]
MNFRFGIKLTMTMIVFAIAISFTIATNDYLRLRDQAIQNKLDQVQRDEQLAKYALETIEKAYSVFGDNIALKMKDTSVQLLDMYEANPSFDTWDFASLKQFLSLDIYIINDQNTITHSSFKQDIGLNFSKCCKKLSKVLDERRASGEFFHDGIDIEQKTGHIKKYSYMPTRDKKYIIQLGLSLQEGDIFHKFNFLSTIEELVQRSSSINEIHVLNTGGYALGDPANDHAHKLTSERRSAFEETLKTGKTTEYIGEWNNEPAIYRYVYYLSEYDKGATNRKVLEIVYNDKDLQAILTDHKHKFIIQLMIILICTIILSILISSWVSRPMYLAFHDSLTGLNNRAALDERLESAISKNKGSTALLMIDLDNFKLVNDHLGHDTGDHLLKCVAQCLRKVSRNEDTPIRLGGDEFVLIMPSASKEDAEHAAKKLITSILNTTAQEIDLDGERVTVSIGIALAPEHGEDTDMLCKRADIALYASKEKGKNQYQFYA